MAEIIKGNFSDNGESQVFKAGKFVIHLGTDSKSNFGGGTVSLKSFSAAGMDWTTDSTTYTSMDIIKQDAAMLNSNFKIVLAGSTSPDLDYSIVYE